MKATTSQLMLRAAELFDTYELNPLELYSNAAGYPLGIDDDNIHSLCMMGAVKLAAHQLHVKWESSNDYYRLSPEVTKRGFTGFSLRYTKAEVQAELRKMAKAAELIDA